MKKNLIKLVTVSAIFAIGLGIAINSQTKTVALEAAQHSGNFANYTYSGSYYNSLATTGGDGLNGGFRKALTTHIYPKGWYIYSGGGSDHLSGVLQDADEDPSNTSNMILFYTRDSIKKTAATVNGTMIWNREHVWPQSLSTNKSGTQCWGTEEAGTDILHLRPSYETTNSFRGNTRYGDCNKSPAQTYNGMTYGYGTKNGAYFEPLDEVKGDVARIIMYTWTTYSDHYSGLDITKTIQDYDTLLKWHTMDKPDAMEGHRNDYCETSKQKNRNPFVDHPEYAWRIFGDSCSAKVKNDCMAAYPGESGQGNNNNSSSQVPDSSTVTPVAGTYNVVFSNNGSDSGTLVTEETFNNYVSSNTLVASVSNLSKVYPGTSGLKLGSGSANGTITFNLKDAAKNKIEKIAIESTKYGSDTGTLEVKLDGQSVKAGIVPGKTANINLANLANANSITVSTSEKRAYLNKITVYIHEDQPEPGPSSSEQPISSDDPIQHDCELPEDSSQISEPTVEPKPEEKGCGGSILTSLSLVSFSAIAGLVLILSKKKKD